MNTTRDPAAVQPFVDTIIIFTTRMAELAEFYRQGLALQAPQAHGDKHLGFRLPGVYLGFDQVDEVPGPGRGGTSVWFGVVDIQETFDRFVALDAEVGYPPTVKPMGDTLAALYDLDGNLFGLAQRG